MTDAKEREALLNGLAKEMGDAGYCNYAACREFLDRAYSAGLAAPREQLLEEIRNDPGNVLFGKPLKVVRVEWASAAERERELRKLLAHAIDWTKGYGHDWEEMPDWVNEADRVLERSQKKNLPGKNHD